MDSPHPETSISAAGIKQYNSDELVQERMQCMQIMNGHVVASMQIPGIVDQLHKIKCPSPSFLRNG